MLIKVPYMRQEAVRRLRLVRRTARVIAVTGTGKMTGGGSMITGQKESCILISGIKNFLSWKRTAMEKPKQMQP